jgi:hypothetical protein
MATEAALLQFVIPNRRRWPRYPIDVPLRVVAEKDGRPSLIEGRGKDLNEGGMGVFAGTELAVGEHLCVELTPAYGQPVRVRCKVRNRRGYVYGVEFLMETEQDKSRVNYIRTVLRALRAPD